MVDIRSEHDIETVRQVAILLDNENGRLVEMVKKLRLENAALQGRDPSTLQLELDLAQELLAKQNRSLFGRSSERRPGADGAAAQGNPSPRKGHGPKAQPALPVVEQVHDLPEADRGCTVCGGTLKPMGEQAEESEEISVVERRFVVVKHRRQKYRCACNGNVVTAQAPPRLIPGGRYSLDFAIGVAADKYLDHLPLERQARKMSREGLDVNSQVLWDQTNALARVLLSAYEALGLEVLLAPLIYADETYWPLASKGDKACRHWAWLKASADTAFYLILDSRSKSAAEVVLEDYGGIVMADGYAAYTALARGAPGFTLVHCWAHARRKFVEAEPNAPEVCRPVLDMIGELYAVEREVPKPGPGAADDQVQGSLDLRAKLRSERSTQIVRRIQQWVYEVRPGVLPQSGVGKAIDYMTGIWEGLTRFLQDPCIPLDNNHAERALRGVVVGRKNHYGSRSLRGTQVAALFYTLFETAKLRGIDPKAFVRDLAAKALEETAVGAAGREMAPGAITG
jgi:transposase